MTLEIEAGVKGEKVMERASWRSNLELCFAQKKCALSIKVIVGDNRFAK